MSMENIKYEDVQPEDIVLVQTIYGSYLCGVTESIDSEKLLLWIGVNCTLTIQREGINEILIYRTTGGETE